MQAALQAHVDNAIAKTVAVAHDFPFAAFRTLYERADALGLKGCAAFRAGGVRGNVIASHCSGAPG
jgi:ribonucleoside-diphosphate reductase alpha chain